MFTHSYISSSEQYKGYRLDVVMTQDSNHLSVYHRICNVYNIEDERVSVCKSKKEAKDLIDAGAIQIYESMRK